MKTTPSSIPQPRIYELRCLIFGILTEPKTILLIQEQLLPKRFSLRTIRNQLRILEEVGDVKRTRKSNEASLFVRRDA